jgi:hypothetical protein
MTEAWLLIDEAAIRAAADNPSGVTQLTLPPIAALEECPDPKALLESLILTASEKSGRRLAQLKRDVASRRGRIAELTRDFSPLLRLPAFAEFRRRTADAVAALGLR